MLKPRLEAFAERQLIHLAGSGKRKRMARSQSTLRSKEKPDTALKAACERHDDPSSARDSDFDSVAACQEAGTGESRHAVSSAKQFGSA